MSELISKQKVLSEIAFAMVDDYPDVQALYDKIESAETTQPTLNENQQEILDWLQAYGDKDGGDKPFQTIFYISECLRTGRLDYSTLANLSKLNRKQQAQVLQLFANWVLDQEAE